MSDLTETKLGVSFGYLTEIKIPSGITTIGEIVFDESEYLTYVYIPTSVTKIEFGAFHNCYALTEIHYGGTMAQWNQIERTESCADDYTIVCRDGTI